MPTNKDFKRLVHARMRKTGEAYTAARARLLRKPQPRRSQQPRPTEPPATAAVTDTATRDYAALAGMSDATLAAKTGCSWERWVRALDHVGAREWSHRAIAEHVRGAIRGLGLVGAGRDGGL